jgi:hypothetical protein
LGEDTRNYIASATGGIRNDEPDGFAGKALRERRLHNQRNETGEKGDALYGHFVPAYCWTPD